MILLLECVQKIYCNILNMKYICIVGYYCQSILGYAEGCINIFSTFYMNAKIFFSRIVLSRCCHRPSADRLVFIDNLSISQQI